VAKDSFAAILAGDKHHLVITVPVKERFRVEDLVKLKIAGLQEKSGCIVEIVETLDEKRQVLAFQHVHVTGALCCEMRRTT